MGWLLVLLSCTPDACARLGRDGIGAAGLDWIGLDWEMQQKQLLIDDRVTQEAF